MLIKRPIYDLKLKCVGTEIVASKNAENAANLLKHFSIIIKYLDGKSPLFIPYSLKFLTERPDCVIDSPIILKLHADEIDKTCPRAELENSEHTFSLQFDSPQHLAWLNFADYIALSETLMNSANVAKVVKYSQEKKHKVIAYNISKTERFDRCKSMSIDYYCGGFLYEPVAEANTDIASDKANLIKLIDTIQKDEIDVDQITTLIEADPILSFQLLKITNSASFSGFEKVESIQQAIMRLGINNLKNWITVISMKEVSSKPPELVDSGLLRGLMSKKIAKHYPEVPPQSAYTAGLLSVLDSLMDCQMSTIISQIAVSEDIKNALMTHEGQLGKVLATAIACEEGRLDEVLSDKANLSIDLAEIYIESMEEIALSKKERKDKQNF